MITHLAMVMDGNRRWAKQRSMQPWLGHRQGVQVIKDVINFCLEKNIKHLSLYTFSVENFKRDPQELSYLFETLVEESENHLDFLFEKEVKVKFIGDRSLFPENVLQKSIKIEQSTQDLSKLQVNLLFCYGGQQEILAGVKKIVSQVKQGLLDENDLSEKKFQENLWTYGIPEPDLIIRTGGMHRLSNFLLFQAAYSELYFLDCLWPDINLEHLNNAYKHFENTKRNFGI
ncbi:polyprenyl diphosphate synthase [Candidatus Dependentiae bacterium]|nr:polyprenyl diphosphate synthase [Candidatus Dependentiae bacterium]